MFYIIIYNPSLSTALFPYGLQRHVKQHEFFYELFKRMFFLFLVDTENFEMRFRIYSEVI